MKTLFDYGGPEKEYPDAFLFLSVLSGQLLKIDSDISIVLWSQWVGDIKHFYDEIIKVSGIDIEMILKRCLTKIEGYILTNEKNYYNDLNNLVRDKRFLLLVNQTYQEDICKRLNIKKVEPKPELDFNKYAFANIKLSRKSRTVDMVVKNRLYTNFTNFFKKPKHIDRPFTVYGWSGTLFDGKVPLEGPYVSSMTRSGGVIQPTDLNHNLALYYSLDDKIVINNKPDETPELIKPGKKHLISFIISDGDNIGMVDSKTKRELSQMRNFPVNWTLNPSAPKVFIKYIYDRIGEFKDGIVVAPSGTGYMFPSETINKSSYWNPLKQQMDELGLTVINQISISLKGALSLIGSYFFNMNIFNKIPKTITNRTTKAVLAYDYFDYSRGNGKMKTDPKTGTRILTPGPLRLYFQKDLEKFKNFKWSNEPTRIIVAVNFNLFKIEQLKEIVKSLPDDVQIVNIHTLLNNS